MVNGSLTVRCLGRREAPAEAAPRTRAGELTSVRSSQLITVRFLMSPQSDNYKH